MRHICFPDTHRRYEVQSLGLFSSYVRGDQHIRSDLDLSVEFNDRQPTTMVQFIVLENYQDNLPRATIESVEDDTLEPAIKPILW